MASGHETRIDPRAVVNPAAELDFDVTVGPFSIVGPKVRIGSGTVIRSHAVVEGNTTIGRDNRIFQFASIGTDPQDLKFAGEDSKLIIGDGNTFRECCTVHKGTEHGEGETRVGNGNLVMAYAHVAHVCVVGDGVILGNGATLAGHVTIDDRAILSSLVGVHQFCRVGTMTMISGGAMLSKDVPPYMMAQGDRATLKGLNLVGLQRAGFSTDTITALKASYRILFRSNMVLDEAVDTVRKEAADVPEVDHLVEFLLASERGFIRC